MNEQVVEDAGGEWVARRRRRVRQTELHEARRAHGRLHPLPGSSYIPNIIKRRRHGMAAVEARGK